MKKKQQQKQQQNQLPNTFSSLHIFLILRNVLLEHKVNVDAEIRT